MPPALQAVHVRINDAATGKPTPCRVRFTDGDGRYYAPYGRLTEFPTGIHEDVGGNVLVGGKKFAYIDGAGEIDLPPGAMRVEVHKGPEYRPIAQDLTIQAGKLSLRLTLERWANPRAEGWWSGDVLAHFLSPRAALLEGLAEDLAVVEVLSAPFPHRQPGRADLMTYPGILEFSGQEAALASADIQVAVNTLNTSPLGNLALLHCHRVVHPLQFGPVTWTLADWCGQCHRKRGLVLWPDVEGWRRDPSSTLVSEALANLILGDIDGLILSDPQSRPEAFLTWYHLLNCGLRVPLAGGSGKNGNNVPLGRMRTFARLPQGEARDLHQWIEAVRSGRTFVSSGPLLDFRVAVHEAGSTIILAPGRDTVRVEAKARALTALTKLQIVSAGEVVAEASATESAPHEVELAAEVPVGESTWLAARCWGPDGMAHSSPVYVQKPERPFRPRPASLEYVLGWLEGYPRLLSRLEAEGLLPAGRDRDKLVATFEAARGKLQGFRERET